MKIYWKNNRKLNPQVILNKIEKCQSISENGSVGYDAADYKDAFAALSSMIVFPVKVKQELFVDYIIKKG